MDSFADGDEIEGRVVSFDEHVGLGEISFATNEETEEIIPFHCTNIGDGSRSINEGAKVHFVVFKHPMGRFEAKDIAPVEER